MVIRLDIIELIVLCGAFFSLGLIVRDIINEFRGLL